MIAVCSLEYPKIGNMTILNVDMWKDQNSGEKKKINLIGGKTSTSITDLTRLIEYNSWLHFPCLPQSHGYFRFPFPCRALGYSSIEFPEISPSITATRTQSCSITAAILAVELRCDLQQPISNDWQSNIMCATLHSWRLGVVSHEGQGWAGRLPTRATVGR